MPADPETFMVETPQGEFLYHHVDDTLNAPGATTPLRVVGEVCVQLSGTATSITAIVERSTRDPVQGPNWAPAGDPITGNPSTGLPIKRYMEPTRGWWRVHITALSGGSVISDVSGQKA
jgi:hypothetical protein